MMLEAISPGIRIRVTSKIREYQQRCSARILGLGLNRFPYFRAESVGAPNPVHIKRERTCVSDIDIVHRDPEQAGGGLLHQLAGNVNRKLVRARKSPGMRFEIID